MPASVKLERWTPKKAEAALGKNHVNRNISEGKVTQYSRDMREKRWTFCPEPITFDEEGNLIDGQHRLMSQIQEGMTINWVVVRQAPREAQKTINTGKVRSLADMMKFEGVTSSRTVGAVARLCLSMDTGRIYMQKNKMTASHTEVLDFFEKYPNIEHSANLAQHIVKGGLLHTQPSALGAAHWWITQHVGLTEADEFLGRMTTAGGISESDGSPVMALISRLNRISEKGVRIEARWIVYMVLKCWNYDVMGSKIYSITAMTKDGEYKLITPRKPGLDHGMNGDLTEDEIADDQAAS